jgi:RNA polymerase-binding transcription factor DksA
VPLEATLNFQSLAEQLREKLIQPEQRLASIRADIRKGHSPDFAELAQERENTEVLEEINREAQATIAGVRFALVRIREGAYGQCTSCGGNISAERLQAISESGSCVSCADNTA